MKRFIALLLIFILTLSFCACGDKPKNNQSDDGDASGGNSNGTVVTLDPTAKELLSAFKYSSVYERDGNTSSEIILVDINWNENGMIAEGYEEGSEGRSAVYIEATLDDQKRPATLKRTVTSPEGEVREERAEFSYPNEYTIKLTNYGFGDGENYVIYEYNEKGLLIREEYPNYTRGYEYDDKSNCTKEWTDYVSEESTDREYTTVYTYDENGKAIFSIKTNTSNGTEVQCTYYYYPNGNLMYVTEITSDGNVNTNFSAYNKKSMLGWSYGKSAAGGMECTATKDSNGRIIKVDGVNTYSGKTFVSTFTYDDKGNLTAHQSFYDSSYRWEYDAQNRPVKQIKEYNGITDTTTYTYDDLGRLIKEEMTATDEESDIDLREYNEEGMVTKRTETHVYSDGQISTNTMELTYVENAKCHVNPQWTDFFLKNVLGSF